MNTAASPADRRRVLDGWRARTLLWSWGAVAAAFLTVAFAMRLVGTQRMILGNAVAAVFYLAFWLHVVVLHGDARVRGRRARTEEDELAGRDRVLSRLYLRAAVFRR